MSGDHSTGPSNRLASETSPYLLQHAHDPVDWYPWGPEAHARARETDRPIFLSIGYAACHWCHVMARESFRDPATAALLNEGFVSIKVDREERPDLDAVYMDAVQALTGSGGWPMSVFLTPDGHPFYGGTYFPPDRRHGLPSFRDVLAGISEAWRERRADVERAGAAVVEAIAAATTSRPGTPGAVAPGTLRAACAALATDFDPRNGGWGGAPKFPQPMAIEWLLRHHAATGDAEALAMALRTLDRMADGGIRDHLGGGFARYSTDAAWLVPHFEKMLYDNAQLARAYLHAWQVTGDGRYLDVATETLDFLLREMALPDGAFAASLDADTHGVEGATYTWTAEEVDEVLGATDAADEPGLAAGAAGVADEPGLGALFREAYGVTDGGNWEGRTVLSRVRDDATLATRHGLAAPAVAARLREARRALLARRDARPRPERDDKAVVAWNGLAIGALADAARHLASGPEADRAAAYLAAATGAAEAVVAFAVDEDGRLHRSWKDGRAGGPAALEDEADLADGLLALYAATFDERWYLAAHERGAAILARYRDPAGGFFDAADDAEQLVVRPRSVQDNALPSGGAMAASVLLRLAAYCGESAEAEAATAAIAGVGELAGRHPLAFAWWLVAMDLAVRGVDEVAIVGDRADAATTALVDVTRGSFLARAIVACGPDPAASAIPLLQARFALDGRPTAFVCRDFACRRPVTRPEALEALLAAGEGPAPHADGAVLP
ncbi:MAG: thioredoxin domain-containing protein [Chloroflexi bacterium]|jgi:hypothetical protein|nr:thioredoxin domain-containing protein [Chloroflexota bacterium]